MEYLKTLGFHNYDCYDDFPPQSVPSDKKITENGCYHHSPLFQPRILLEHVTVIVENPNNYLQQLTNVMDIYVNYTRQFQDHYNSDVFAMPACGKWDDIVDWFLDECDESMMQWKRINYLKYLLS